MNGVRNEHGFEVSMGLYDHLIDLGKMQTGSIRQRGSAAVLELHLKTGDNPLHLLISAYAGLATLIDVIRGVTITGTANGAAKKMFNRNGMVKDDDLLTKAYIGPTYTGGEVSKENQAGMGTTPGQASAGAISASLGYKIPPNVSWVFKFSPAGSTDLVVTWDAFEDLD